MQQHWIFHGRVQGVGFRIRMKQKADELGVSGWVKNLPDSTVEAAAQGDADDLRSLLAYCRTLGDVDHVDVDEAAERDLEGFSIRY